MKNELNLFLGLGAIFFACNAGSNNTVTVTQQPNKDSIIDQNVQGVVSPEIGSKTTPSSEMDSLIKCWNWSERVIKPTISCISNFKWSSGMLFKTWTWSDRKENEPAFRFEKDSLDFYSEGKYVFMINYDSLRIFTSYEQPGDGITRGIITKLTKDSLVIAWSSGDCNNYVPFHPK